MYSEKSFYCIPEKNLFLKFWCIINGHNSPHSIISKLTAKYFWAKSNTRLESVLKNCEASELDEHIVYTFCTLENKEIGFKASEFFSYKFDQYTKHQCRS